MNDYYAYISQINNLEEQVVKSLEYINWKKIVKKDDVIFIKPNFTFPYYKKGITTTPELIKIVLNKFKDRADNVIIGESDGGNNSFRAYDAFNGHNMHEICKETGVELVNLSDLPSRIVEEKIQGKEVKVELPKLLLDKVDCNVSLPVLKVHVMTNVTLSIKNLWGCNPNAMRCLHHKNLSEKLTLIAKKLNPKIVITDGIYALDGHGPMFGTPKKTNLILSSNNPVVADSIGSYIMGIPIEKVDHVVLSGKEGLGTTNISKVHINDSLKKYKTSFNVNKTFMDNLSVLLFNSETLAKVVMDSPITPLIYSCAKFIRNSDEQKLANEMERFNK